MPDISREMLESYIEDALNTEETAQVEHALRDSDELRKQLRAMMHDVDRGEHSIGAVWRRQRLTCFTREQLGSYLLQTLDPDMQDYVTFHLETIGCAYCQANLEDLKSMHQQQNDETKKRRKKIFQSGAGLLKGQDQGK